jgi:3-keto-disaccharide hydrolase
MKHESSRSASQSGCPLAAQTIFCQAGGVRRFFWLALMAFGLAARGAEIHIDFGDFATGKSPDGFYSVLVGGSEPGDWKITTEKVPSAFTPLTPGASPRMVQQAVLAQTSQSPSTERFPLLIYDKETFKDFNLATRFKITGGALEQVAGVVFHFENESNFYVICADAMANTFYCYKVENGEWKPPLGSGLKISQGGWHQLAVQCEGNRIVGSLDGNDAIKLVDSTYDGNPGKIGFITKGDTTADFGNTTVNFSPIVPMAQTLVQNIMEKYPRILGLRIYVLDAKKHPHVIASKDKKEIGRPGTSAEEGAITNGAVYFGRGIGTVAVTMPLRDRNGNPIAAVRVELKSFVGETEDTATDRARAIVQKMQAQALTRQDLLQ